MIPVLLSNASKVTLFKPLAIEMTSDFQCFPLSFSGFIYKYLERLNEQ